MNNFSMTYKNAKTILFAGLIAAMILPFSGMEFATAEEQTGERNDKAEKIAQSIKELKDKKNKSVSTEDKKQIDETIKRLKIAEDLAKLEAKGLQSSPQAQDLLSQLEKEINSKGVAVKSHITSEAETVPMSSGDGWRYDTFATYLQVTSSCNNVVTGQATGSLTQYDEISYWIVTTDYPSVLNCNKIHNDSPARIADLSGSLLPTCDVTIPYHVGTAYVTCEDFGLHDDNLTVNTILVTSNAYYENGWLDIPFTALPGWTLIVYD